jgi:hypothetical protein
MRLSSMLGENPNDYSTGITAGEVFYQDLVGQPVPSAGSAVSETGQLRKARLSHPYGRWGVCAEPDSPEAEHEGVDEPAALCFSQLEH